MLSSPEKVAAAAQKKRDREKARYALKKGSLRKKARLRKGTQQYNEATARLEAQISFHDEVIVFMEDRVLDLGARVSVLTAELGQLEASSEYLKEVFSEALEGSPAKIILQEVESDLQTVTRDLRKAAARQSYYITRGQVAKNSKEDAQMALDKEKDKYMELSHLLQISPGKKTGGHESDSPLPPSSEPANSEYTIPSLSQLAAAHSNDDDIEADDLESQSDGDGQPPIPQASWDGRDDNI